MRKPLLPVLILAVLLMATDSCLAGKLEHWGEYGIQKKITDRVSLKSDIQLRIRDNVSDFYWLRLEVGPNIKISNRWLNLMVLFRVKPQEYGGRWRRQYNIFIDPVFKLYHNGTTTFDIRTRVHTQLNDQGREFIRIRPRLTHRFMLGKVRCAWITYNDFWLQTSSLGPRSRYNTNWLATGFKWGLNKPAVFSLYFQYRSDKLPANSNWDHDPVIGTSVFYRF